MKEALYAIQKKTKQATTLPKFGIMVAGMCL